MASAWQRGGLGPPGQPEGRAWPASRRSERAGPQRRNCDGRAKPPGAGPGRLAASARRRRLPGQAGGCHRAPEHAAPCGHDHYRAGAPSRREALFRRPCLRQPRARTGPGGARARRRAARGCGGSPGKGGGPGQGPAGGGQAVRGARGRRRRARRARLRAARAAAKHRAAGARPGDAAWCALTLTQLIAFQELRRPPQAAMHIVYSLRDACTRAGDTPARGTLPSYRYASPPKRAAFCIIVKGPAWPKRSRGAPARRCRAVQACAPTSAPPSPTRTPPAPLLPFLQPSAYQ